MATSHSTTAPEPVDVSHYFSHVTQARNASSVKKFYKYFQIPGIGNVAGGMPNHNYFPFDTLEASAAKPDRFKPTPTRPIDPPSSNEALSQSSLSEDGPSAQHVIVPHESSVSDVMREVDVKTALQYGTAQGYPPLYTFLRQFTREILHPNIPYYGGPEIILTCGNTDGFAKSIEALTEPWFEGRDAIEDKQGMLCEEFAYMNALQTVKPRGLNIVPVRVDDEGMAVEGKGGMRDVLENWDYGKGKLPHLIYTVTIGQNPTSGVLSVTRRKAIYELCVEHDILILEDDPYWYLQFPSANDHNGKTAPCEVNYNKPKSSGFAFLDSLVPSFLSVDYEGRVIRLDTFSKTVAPGCRLGWLTAQPAVVERILRITETSTQQPSGFVQAMIAQLLLGQEGAVAEGAIATAPGRGFGGLFGGRSAPKDDTPAEHGWKVDGWVRWLEGLRGNYERRMNAMCAALEARQYVVKAGRRPSLDAMAAQPADVVISSSGGSGSGIETLEDNAAVADGWSVVSKTKLLDFDWPMGGMFVWVRVLFENHPLASKYPGQKLSHALWVHLTTKPFLVLVAPGEMFSPTDEIRDGKGWRYFRLCFAAVDEDEVKSVSVRFARGVADFWRKKDIDDVDALVAKAETMREGEGMDMVNMEGLVSLMGIC